MGRTLRPGAWVVWSIIFCSFSSAYRYDPAYTEYNINENQTAVNPLDYWGEWSGHEYTPSPKNWRFPFYTLFLDRFVNGDPTNDNINGTAYEHDVDSNQMRHGGDLQGLVDTLDYLQGMGVKGLYIAGSPFINRPWGYDQYSPLDLTILDPHFGNLELWRSTVNEIHARGMYVLLDNTFATLGDLIGFQGYLNETTPFTLNEHKVQWKDPTRHYYDFEFGNTYNETCEYPRFWNETGFPVDQYVTDSMKGCYDSEFDQYGDTEAFGVFPDWRRELSKFASVQDRLREWYPPVRAKIERFYCILMAQLDIDGYRYDKATQATPDAMGYMNKAMRECARELGKDNFFLPGEITGGNDFGAIFLGRGRQPDQVPENLTHAASLTKNSSDEYFLRGKELAGLDSGAFHYTTYRTMTRFLGMDGNLAAGYDAPINWVDQWNYFLQTNDMVNPNTGVLDPRHMFGTTNQDVFRWPAIKQGTERQLLGHFVTTLVLPGIPLLLWGEEQEFYVLDNTASNYIFGRQPLSSASAWQTHGCYHLSSTQYYQMPLEAARDGCSDNTVSYDHRDPAAPVRNIIRHMMKLREAYPVLNDGFFLQQLSNQTEEVSYPGSSGVVTETGMWSVMRSEFEGVQELSNDGGGYPPVWFVYSNLNRSKTYEFDCMNNATARNLTALIAPYDTETTVKNLLYPFDEKTLEDSAQYFGINGSTNPNGCLSSLDMVAYDFRAYVPKEQWVGPSPMITRFYPGHDARIQSTVGPDDTEDLDVTLHFSAPMDCDGITTSITFDSHTHSGASPTIDKDSVKCGLVDAANSTLVGAIQSVWSWDATLTGVANGIHGLTVHNVSNAGGNMSTDSIDHFIFRIGQLDNPVVFPRAANYSKTLLSQSDDGKLKLHHAAAGADQFRYSTNFGSSFSDWTPYEGGVHEIQKQDWSGTDLQAWKGEHVRVEYFTRLGGTSDHVQEADVDSKQRRFPNLWLNGPYNEYGYDAGLNNRVHLTDDNEWTHHWMVEWKRDGSLAQLNVWGVNPDGLPDQTIVMGDADGDSVLDRLPPSALSAVVLNVTSPPPKPHLSWTFVINDGTRRFQLVPTGNMWIQLAIYVLLWTVPILIGILSTWLYMQSFYGVKFNEIGIAPSGGWIPSVFRRRFQRLPDEEQHGEKSDSKGILSIFGSRLEKSIQPSDALQQIQSQTRRMVLIATMEYDIEDWAIKIKIGGLGVMAQLMGKNLGHQDLVWVVPCVGGVDYPTDETAEPMSVTIMDVTYEVNVQYHKLRNITYVLLDAPVFRQQTKSEPYPARMDDMTSAVYYSAWNQCIAQAIERFPVDLYHINDYHGTIAPLYLLPKTIPAALSLHNAEFQGLWPMRTKKERKEVCSVYNLPWEVVREYVMYGEIFNLLHAGASYLRVHQQGFGAVGVSKKYGKRSYARYPILWGLKKVQALPNPDPSDTGEWDKKLPKEEDIHVDSAFEKERLDTRVEAQEWAGLEKNPNAELFVFVGRWSMQKGIDLIADAFPAILEANPNVQLITVGPVIDLYGKFAALKLDRLMQMYPKRVCSKPVFTALPPCIFAGAEFALIPSRDEPFGLVAVEFGRKGALGVGARVGGLGQMPGWWFTVESTAASHLLKQFKEAIREAIGSSAKTRAMMRARSAKQRFPVAQWVEDLEILQSTSIRLHDKVIRDKENPASFGNQYRNSFGLGIKTQPSTASHSRVSSYGGSQLMPNPETSHAPPVPALPAAHAPQTARPSPEFSTRDEHGSDKIVVSPPTGSDDHDFGIDIHVTPPQQGGSKLSRRASLGSRSGPGHARVKDTHDGAADRTLTGGQNFLPTVPDVSEMNTVHAMSGYRESDYESEDDRASINTHGDQYSLYSFDEEGTPAMARPIPGRIRQHRMYEDYPPYLENEPPQHWPLSPPTPGSPSVPSTPRMSSDLMPPPRVFSETSSPHHSMLSLDLVVGEKKDFKLQKVDPFFTDSSGVFYNAFETKLQTLDGKNSETTNCIEEYLIKAEKTWFSMFRNAKLGRMRREGAYSNVSSCRNSLSRARPAAAVATSEFEMDSDVEEDNASLAEEFLLGKDYKPPTGIRKWMQMRPRDWPVYAYILAAGQIMAANSYQITLLTGEVGQTASKLYVIASIYLATSIVWWYLFRRFASRLSLSLPFFFYGLSFILIGVAPYTSFAQRTWIQNCGSGFYSLASSSGALFFALNFGDEGGAQIKTWVFRACVIQGTQHMYVVALWFWGTALTVQRSAGIVTTTGSIIGTWKITAITLPLAAVCWIAGVLLWLGLPDYYRQAPGKMPSFYRSAMKRKVVLWFFVAVIIQNFFLSAPYGRNWNFLFSSDYAKGWQVMLLVLFFFIGVWAAVLAVFGHLSKSHSWILPLFAIGLGAPRWAQIWWGTSNLGLYLPWVGPWANSYVASALVSRALWLWLGVLDAIQGVGLGMILLATLTRVHVAFAVVAQQCLGSLATIAARAVAPNRIGPGPISPDISAGIGAIGTPWFWVGLIANLLICVGFYKFYRKEQLQKP